LFLSHKLFLVCEYKNKIQYIHNDNNAQAVSNAGSKTQWGVPRRII
jgi:hypothetical protein